MTAKLLPKLISICVLSGIISTHGYTAEARYLEPTTVNLLEILSVPPADDSAETKREIDIVLREQSRRSPEDVARTQLEDDFQPACYADVLGSKYTEENLPLTFGMLRKALNNAREISNTAKEIWNRPRPPSADARIRPVVTVPKNGSYPSGHAARGYLGALLLGELFPERRMVLFERGWLIGWDRVIGGVHYPSDIAAGTKLGEVVGQLLLGSHDFKADLVEAREECKSVYGLH